MPEPPGLPDAVRRIADANLRYYQGLGRLTVDYVRAVAGLVGDLRSAVAPAFAPPTAAGPAPAPPPAAAPPPPAAVLVLEGEAGAEAGAVFRVSNDLRRSVSAPVVVSPFHDETGGEHRLALRVAPEVVELEAGAQTLVEVRAAIPAEAEVGVAYRAEITVPGLGTSGVPVVLRRLPDPLPAPTPAGATKGARAAKGPGAPAAPARARRGRRPPAA
jgi:hypothetical protein